jgi:hypothetical protein
VGAETSPADVSRFDSGAFTFRESLAEDLLNDTAPLLDPVPYSRSAGTTDAVSRAAIKRADEPPQSLSETADLLASLRRRRGEREAAAFESSQSESHHSGLTNNAGAQPAGPGIRLVGHPVETAAEPSGAHSADASAAPADTPRNAWSAQAAASQTPSATPRPAGNHGKRGRASMPSWDEIVFGARTDDDLP